MWHYLSVAVKCLTAIQVASPRHQFYSQATWCLCVHAGMTTNCWRGLLVNNHLGGGWGTLMGAALVASSSNLCHIYYLKKSKRCVAI